MKVSKKTDKKFEKVPESYEENGKIRRKSA